MKSELELITENRDHLRQLLIEAQSDVKTFQEKAEELYIALDGLVKDVKNKPNDTRYATHIKIAEGALNNFRMKKDF